MKILVTGGLGAIGEVLVNRLGAKNHEVWFCDLQHHHHPNYLKCDVRHFRQLQEVFANHVFDYVYHLAAEFGRHNGEDYYENLWQTNVVGTKNIIVLQRQYGFRLVFFSSSEVYGDYDGIMHEDVLERIPIRQLNDYAMTKWVNERQIQNASDAHQTESVRVRLFNIYGPGERYSPYRSAVCVFIYRALHGLSYKVYLDHHRSSLFIEDAVETLTNVVDNFKSGMVYNIGSRDYRSVKSISDLVLKTVGKSDEIVEYVELEPFTTRNKRIDVARAEAELGHEPKISLEEGISRTVAWMRREYARGLG